LSWIYSRLIRHIPAGRPIYGLQARSLTKREMSPDTIEDMAADYLSVIRQIQPSGPYNLVGCSFGGLVAYAMAIQLQSAHQEVALLALLDIYPSAPENSLHSAEQAKEPAFAATLDDLIRNMVDSLRSEGQIAPKLEKYHYDAIKDAIKRSTGLMETFSPQRFNGDLLLFEAAQSKFKSLTETWQPFIEGQITVHQLDCTHEAMMTSLPAAKIGSVLAAELAKQRTTLSNEEQHFRWRRGAAGRTR
jgi:thioesterase domain-containing protein